MLSMKLSENEINELVKECEQMITIATSRTPQSIKDEIKQEMRIKIWRLISEQCTDYVDVHRMVHRRIGSIYKSAKFIVKSKNARYNKRFIPLDASQAENFPVDPPQESFLNIFHAKNTLHELMKSLDNKESFIVYYMLSTDNIDDNYDSLMRQLGYTGKGSIKYIFENIKQKMRKYVSDNNISI